MCNANCVHAEGAICNCECGGAHHGAPTNMRWTSHFCEDMTVWLAYPFALTKVPGESYTLWHWAHRRSMFSTEYDGLDYEHAYCAGFFAKKADASLWVAAAKAYRLEPVGDRVYVRTAKDSWLIPVDADMLAIVA